MKGIKWTKTCNSKYSEYIADLGNIRLYCDPEIKYSHNYGGKKYIKGWYCTVYCGMSLNRKFKGCVRKSLESSQQEAERLATRYLLGAGNLILKQLKRTGLLEEALSEIGVDL